MEYLAKFQLLYIETFRHRRYPFINCCSHILWIVFGALNKFNISLHSNIDGLDVECYIFVRYLLSYSSCLIWRLESVVKIIVCIKQVVDPDMPPGAFQIDSQAKRIKNNSQIPPVINGFDENAVEAALKIKEEVGGIVTVISLGTNFTMDVIKKPLSMGADDLVLLKDELFDDLDSFVTANVLAKAIQKIGSYDLVLCGRQASDWDNAQVPLGIAEILQLPCITMAKYLEVSDRKLAVHSITHDGYDVLETKLPALVTVSNELGEPRYPTLKGIMSAGRKNPTTWNCSDLGMDQSDLDSRLEIMDLFIPTNEQQVEIISGSDEADAGRNLAARLKQDGLI